MNGLSIVIASSGRRSLRSVVNGIMEQMRPGDELLLDYNNDCPYGNKARNRMMLRAREGNGLVFFDDDDRVLPAGLKLMREAFIHDSDRMHIFKIHFATWTLWVEPVVRKSNVSTQMIVVPASWAICSKWGDRYEGDFDFIAGLADRFGHDSIVWHEELVAIHNGLRAAA